MADKEYLEKDALIQAAEETPFTMSMFLNKDQCDGANIARHTFVAIFKTLPAADVRPVVRGKWVDDKGNRIPWDETNKNCPSHSAYCSVCGEWLTASDEYPVIGNYCPNCGAKMAEES